MATQMQRALGTAEGKERVAKKDGIKDATARSERRSGKPIGDKSDPYPGLPRRRLIVDKEG